jgi:hypothetical protein
MQELESLGNRLGDSLTRLTSSWQLDLTTLYEVGPPEEILINEAVWGRESPPQRMVTFHGDTITYFYGRDGQPALDAAFVALWEFCKRCCVTERAVSYEPKYFHVTPEVYAAGLRHAMSLIDRDVV